METTNLVIDSEMKTIQASKTIGNYKVNFNYQHQEGETPSFINFNAQDTTASGDNLTPMSSMGSGFTGNYIAETGKINLSNFEITEDNLLVLTEIELTIQGILTTS